MMVAMILFTLVPVCTYVLEKSKVLNYESVDVVGAAILGVQIYLIRHLRPLAHMAS
jgi:ABC-type cobalamin transport system permease subunit